VLPEFSFEQTLSAIRGKHDKITLYVRHRICEGTSEHIDSFRHFLAVPTAVTQSVAGNADLGGYYGRIFNRPSETGTFWKPLEIRSSRRGSRVAIPLPLFRGKYKFGPRPSSPDETAQIETALELFLNPTRFLRNQNPETYIPPTENFAHTSATFYESPSVTEGDEFSLDRSDNWIPASPEFERLRHPRFLRRIIRDYLEGVMREIDRDTERAAALHEVQVGVREMTIADRFNLKEVETYFDFAVPDGTSIERVRSFEPLLPSFSERPQTATDYPVLRPHLWRENSRVLTISIRPGVKLRIYAKTNKRIRFEVIHGLRHARVLVPGTTVKRKMHHTAPSLAEVYRMLDRLRADAAEIVNRVIRHMRSQASLPATPKAAVDLLFDIVKAIGNAENARTLVSILVHKGSVTSQPQFQTVLAKLRRAGILQAQQESRRREHVVTEQYQHPLEMLRRHSAYPHLTTRHRTRTPRASV
jgi:hypothetical protein